MERIERISREVLDFNGYEAQSLIAIEEMSELIQALSKYRRYGYENASQEIKDNVIEEIADVHNMLVQLEMYFDIEKINKVRIEKIERIKGRIEKKKAEMTGGARE